MKLNKPEPQAFQPVIVMLETQEELDVFVASLNVPTSVLREYNTDMIISDEARGNMKAVTARDLGRGGTP